MGAINDFIERLVYLLQRCNGYLDITRLEAVWLSVFGQPLHPATYGFAGTTARCG